MSDVLEFTLNSTVTRAELSSLSLRGEQFHYQQIGNKIVIYGETTDLIYYSLNIIR